MPVEMSAPQIQAQLQKIREQHGDAVYERARNELAQTLLRQPNGEAFLRTVFPDLDIEALKAAPQDTEASPEQVMLRLLQQQVPSIKTQGHFNLFAAAFDALRVTLDAYFTGELDRAEKGRAALDKLLDQAGKVKDIIEKLDEIPAADRSEKANEYMEPPKEFHEYDTQRQLLVELAGITTRGELGNWYARTKDLRDRVTSQKLRNELIDAIRKKRNEFEAQEAN